MTLFEFYKKATFEYGYHTSAVGKDMKTEETSIDYEDEFDYYICADYYGSYVGSKEDWKDNDLRFLKVLGFTPEDFEE